MTPAGYSEQDLVEGPALDLLDQLGFEITTAYTEQFGRDPVAAGAPGRDDRSQVVLHHRLRPKLAELNPDLPAAALDLALEQLVLDRSPMERVRANQAFWKLLRDGAKVTYTDDDDGARTTQTVRFVDWTAPTNNDFLAVNQFWVTGPLHTRRCDIVCFVNGIPLVLFELKASHKSIQHAFSKNLRDYRDTIAQLFVPNALVILSNGAETKVGSTFAEWERFGEWKRIADEEEPGVVSLETAICGLCEPARLLDAVENFVAYLEQIKTDRVLAERFAELFKGKKAFFAVPSPELLNGDESHQVEFKSTARWNLRDRCKDKRMEDAVVKTVAAFLNTDGGTLFIGVDDERRPIGPSHDTALVRPPNADGLVNWLSTHLVNAMTNAAVMRTRTRIDQIDGAEVCRVDVAESSVPVYARMSSKDEVFWVRMNDSTRALPEIEIEEYVRDRW